MFSSNFIYSYSTIIRVATYFPFSDSTQVLARGVDCDIALLSVESEEFWKDAEPLQLGQLPCLQV